MRRPQISFFLSLVAVSALAATGCHSAEKGEGLPPASGSGAPPAPSIPKLAEVANTAPAAAADDSSAAWTGSLFARHEAELGPKMSGILSQVAVEEGDHVKKGQLLFRLESAQAGLQVEQAKAAIASAQVGFEAAKLDFGRATELFQKGAIAPASFDQAKSGFDRANTGLAQAKVGLQVAQRGLVDTSVVSPIDGVVTAKSKSVGETVTMMPPTIVLIVQDVDKLELRAHVPESALLSIKPGGTLKMTVRAAAVTRDVPVKRVNPAVDPRTRTVEVIADVDNADGKLKVGMLALVGTTETAAPAATGAPTGATATKTDGKLAGATEGIKAP